MPKPPVTAWAVMSSEGTIYHVPDDPNHDLKNRTICGLSTEVEMQEFLYGLVRYLKPELVFESGSYLGYGTMALGMACEVNKRGRVVSCEVDQAHAEVARQTVAELPVEIRSCSSLDCPELKEADLIFSDSGFEVRRHEWTVARKGCVFVVHDTRLDPSLNLMVKSNHGLLFDRGRGFGMMIKE